METMARNTKNLIVLVPNNPLITGTQPVSGRNLDKGGMNLLTIENGTGNYLTKQKKIGKL